MPPSPEDHHIDLGLQLRLKKKGITSSPVSVCEQGPAAILELVSKNCLDINSQSWLIIPSASVMNERRVSGSRRGDLYRIH